MKPTIVRNRQIFKVANHQRSKQLCAPLSKDLKEKYSKGSARVVEGDSVKVLRGEFKGIEGKITQISSEKNGIAIEGIKREKLKGGSVDIYIHASNVMITNLNLEDKWRQNRLTGQVVKPEVGTPSDTKELPKEEPKIKKEEKEEKLEKIKEKPKPKQEGKKERTKEKTKEKPKEKTTKPVKATEEKQTKTGKKMKKEKE